MSQYLETTLGNFFQQLGRAFFMTAYLPMLLLVAFNQYVLLSPALGGAPVENYSEAAQPFLGFIDNQLITTLLVPLLLGLVLISLNGVLIRFFEGRFPGSRWLLHPLLRARLRQHQRLYSGLETDRQLYLKLATGKLDSTAAGKTLEQLRLEIDDLHARAEKINPLQILPRAREAVLPTDLGNAFAVIEEYPYERYRMDGALFWPRLRSHIPDTLRQNIDNQKLTLDLTLGLCLVFEIIALEAFVFCLMRQINLSLAMISAGGFLLAWLLYRSAVTAVRTMGLYTSQVYDLQRNAILMDFNLDQPDSLHAERQTWRRLAAFIRRGDDFYFPKNK